MINALKNELIKLFSKKKYIVLLIIALLICAGREGMNLILSKLTHTDIKSANMIMEMFPFFAEVYVPLVVFMAVCDLLSSEMHDLTIKASLLRPVTRFKLLSAKMLSSFIMGAVFYVFILAVCAAMQGVFGELTASYLFKSTAAYLIDLVPLFVLVLFAALINMLCKTPTLSMFMTIVGYAVLKYCNYFSPILNSMLFTSYMQWHKLWIGSIIPFGALFTKVCIIVGTSLLLYTSDYILFDKKEY